jgi:hypothetical protein
MHLKTAIFAAAATCMLAWAPVQVASAAPANFAGASSDGKIAYFTTVEKLVPGDTDGKLDVYERSFDIGVGSFVTREVSTGPVGGNDAFDAFYEGLSVDGGKVFFSTEEALVAADTDRSEDVYARDLAAGTTALVSLGGAPCQPTCGNGNQSAIFFGASADGKRVDFVTAEELSSADTDGMTDIYQRDLVSGATTLASRGSEGCSPICGNGSNGVIFQGASADGSRVYFTTGESLDLEDTDELSDIYVRDLQAETTELISRPGTCPPAVDCAPAFGGVSSDGSRVYFETNERIDGADTDSASDVYLWENGTISRLSFGPTGGNGSTNATYEAAAASGNAIFFETAESLVASDGDSSIDIYERSGSGTSLVSTGPVGGDASLPANLGRISSDGATVLFSTAEALAPEDEDSTIDVYSRSAGTTVLVSTGEDANGAFDVGFAGASNDASHVFFETSEPLLSVDGDNRPDIYERLGGTTQLVSTGPIGHDGNATPNLTDVSADGLHAFFITEERLTEGDLDTERDVYERTSAGTLLVSVSNFLQLGPPTPALTGTNPASPNASTNPSVLGQAEAGTSIKLYATPDCSGAPVGTGDAAQLGGAGIPAVVPPETTTVLRATATDENGDTSSCSSSSVSYRQAAEAPPGGGEEGGDGGDGGTPPGGGTQPGDSPPTDGGKSAGGGRDAGGRNAVSPRTRVTYAPLFKTRLRRPVIGFVDSTEQDGTAFVCKLDKKGWHSCRSPVHLKRLSYGRHVFRVKGFNSGLWETKPAVRRFQVVRR